MAKFTTNANGVIWWSNLQLMHVTNIDNVTNVDNVDNVDIVDIVDIVDNVDHLETLLVTALHLNQLFSRLVVHLISMKTFSLILTLLLLISKISQTEFGVSG